MQYLSNVWLPEQRQNMHVRQEKVKSSCSKPQWQMRTIKPVSNRFVTNKAHSRARVVFRLCGSVGCTIMARSKEYSHPTEDGHKSKTPLFWKIAVIVLLILCIAFLIALIVVAAKLNEATKHDQGDPNGGQESFAAKPCVTEAPGIEISRKSSRIFEDLSADEILAVRDYLYADKDLNLTRYENASIRDNYIFFIKLYPPSKTDALNHLDSKGPKPTREARVSIFAGARKPNPVVEEYIVYPANKPTAHRENRVPGQRYPIPFNARPFDETHESAEITKLLRKETEKLNDLMVESYDGYTFKEKCLDKCLGFLPVSPMGFTSDTRKSWFWFMRVEPGMYENPVNLEFNVNHRGTDVSKWKVEQIVYNNQSFQSADDLLNAYKAKTLKISKIPTPPKSDKLFSSYARRGDPQPAKPSRGPELYEPDGKRYAVDNQRVEYMGWGFEFRVDSVNGMEIYDITFQGERIVYELSLQEAISTYTGYFPSQTYNYYLDSNWRMGMYSYELVPGIDCPQTATFFNLTHMIGTASAVMTKNSVCVFEQNRAIPLRRHYDSNFAGGYTFYGGMTDHVLVLRTIASVYNYDYVWDFTFYQNGVVQVQVSSTGYIMGTYYTDDVKPYGYKLSNYGTATTHEHLFSFKVDLDVLGTENSYETIEVGIESVQSHWENITRVRKVLKPMTKRTELEAAYKFNFDTPTYLNFYHERKKNKMGVRRGYRIQNNGMTKMLYPDDWMLVPMISWGQYQMAVTRYKDSERYSSSPYNQNSPKDPQVNFRKYLRDNESIINQDLVAWVTMGLMHIPHSEDLPNTATVANFASFFIRPFNYFEEDPSMGSTNAILITPGGNGPKVERYGTPTGPVCLPRNYTMDYDGHVIV